MLPALFYRLRSTDAFSQTQLTWSSNEVSSVDPSFLIREIWQFQGPITFSGPLTGPTPQLFQFYVVATNSLKNETYVDNNNGQLYSAVIRTSF